MADEKRTYPAAEADIPFGRGVVMFARAAPVNRLPLLYRHRPFFNRLSGDDLDAWPSTHQARKEPSYERLPLRACHKGRPRHPETKARRSSLSLAARPSDRARPDTECRSCFGPRAYSWERRSHEPSRRGPPVLAAELRHENVILRNESQDAHRERGIAPKLLDDLLLSHPTREATRYEPLARKRACRTRPGRPVESTPRTGRGSETASRR